MGVTELSEIMMKLLKSSVAPSSLQLYKRAWALMRETFSYINQNSNLQIMLPLSVSSMSFYVAYLHRENYAPSSIVSYVSAIGYIHRISGFKDPTTTVIIQKLIAGSTRLGPRFDLRLPITIILLDQLSQSADKVISCYYHRILLKAMFCVAFFGLMRLGELTVSQHGQVLLQLQQLTMSNDKAIVNISHFKHNKSLKPVDIPMEKQDSENVCPVFNLAKYLQVRGYKPGPLFCFPQEKPVSRRFFVSKLKFLLKFCGLDVSRYRSHSFRIGGASYYADLGCTDSQIRRLGRWNGNSFIDYIRAHRLVSK